MAPLPAACRCAGRCRPSPPPPSAGPTPVRPPPLIPAPSSPPMPPRSRAPTRKTLTLAREVSELFGPHLAVLAFPAAGMPTLFGNPTVESVLRSFLPAAAAAADAGTETAYQAAARVAAMWREAGSIEARVAQEEARLRAVAGKVKTAQEEQGREHWWEVDVGALDEAELPEFATALDVLRADILRRINELAKAPKPRRQQ